MNDFHEILDNIDFDVQKLNFRVSNTLKYLIKILLRFIKKFLDNKMFEMNKLLMITAIQTLQSP